LILKDGLVVMAIWKDFTLGTVQTVVFTPDNSAFNSGKILAIVLGKFSERFDGDMQVLPVPLGAPPELPHVMLKSKDGHWGLNISPVRMDSFRKDSEGNLSDIVRECAQVQTEYIRSAKVRVGKLALVVMRLCPVINPAQELIQRFCTEASQQEPFNNSKAFEIHNHKTYTPSVNDINYQINSWVRCQTAERALDHQPIILVTQDLNTVENESLSFDVDQIESFFELAVKEVDEILKKYFPE
jgi:hypothetical protein